MKVELIYEKTCPNIQAARTSLLHAFNELGLKPTWREWEVSDPDIPNHAKNLGSPTILIDCQDISEAPKRGHDMSCRIYRHEDGQVSGVPSIENIKQAMEGSQSVPEKKPFKPWYLNTGLLPVIGTALLPKLACPACWPAYAGLLSAVGLGFIDYTPYLLPTTLIFVLIVLATLLYRAPRRRGYLPFVLGLAASLILVGGKFGYESDVLMYMGIGLLVVASLWNTWPKKLADGEVFCPSCVKSTA